MAPIKLYLHIYLLHLVLIHIQYSLGINFNLENGASKCFYETPIPGFPLYLSYKIYDKPPTISCKIDLFHPDSKIPWKTHHIKTSSTPDRMIINPESDDNLKICIYCFGRRPLSANISWNLEFSYLPRDDYFEDAVLRSNITDQRRTLQEIHSRIDAHYSSVNWRGTKEKAFKNNIMKMTRRTIWLTTLQILLGSLISIYFIYNLASFFKREKLI